MATSKIKKGDTVQVIAGKDKGKDGKVISIDRKKNRLLVEGIHIVLAVACKNIRGITSADINRLDLPCLYHRHERIAVGGIEIYLGRTSRIKKKPQHQRDKYHDQYCENDPEYFLITSHCSLPVI